MNDTQKADELLLQIRSFIAVAHEHAAAGDDVDLSGLDGKVQELCELVLDMPKQDADAYSAPLAALAGELTELKTNMETAQTEVREQLNALNARQKAAKAYTTNKAIGPGKKPEEE